MMNITRMNKINIIMTKATELEELAISAQLTPEDVNHMKALDPMFATTLETLINVFGSVSNPVETVEEALISIPIVEKEEETTPTIEDGEIWKKTETGSEVSNLGHARDKNHNLLKVRMSGGYAVFYDPAVKRNVPLAKNILIAFKGRMNNSYAPVYKDNDKSNCALENLMWGMRNPTLSTDQVERACKLIAENRHLPEGELVNLLVKEHTVRSSGAYQSIMNGEYRTISDRYFIIRSGSIIPVNEEPKTEEPAAPTNSTISTTPVDIDTVRASYISKMMSKSLTEKDSKDFVLTYVLQGYETAETILKAIHHDYGRKVMISGEFIRKLIHK